MKIPSYSMLVIPTPDCCIECPLLRKEELELVAPYTYKQFYTCKVQPEPDEDIDEFDPYLDPLRGKPDWCPLAKIGVDLANGRDRTSPITEKDKELIKKYFGKKGEDK